MLERSRDAGGCSYGNAGLICPSHAEALASPAAIRDGLRWMARRDSPFRLRPRLALVPWLARFGAAALPRRSAPRPPCCARSPSAASAARGAARAGLPTSFARRGILSVYESERGSSARARRRRARDAERGEARELEPALAPGIAGAVHHPDEAHCDPGAFVDALLDGAREHGAEVRTGVEMLRLRRTNGRDRRRSTPPPGRSRRARSCSPPARGRAALAREVGVHVPLEAGQGLPRRARRRARCDGGIPIYMEEARVIATPLGGRAAAGRARSSSSGLDLRVDPVRLASLRARRAAARWRCRADARTVQVWRGLRPCAPDGLPVIGRARASRTSFWPPPMRCSASRWRR